MRSFIILNSLLPLGAIACQSTPDACASAVDSYESAAAFCLTYTQSADTATASLPSFASACSSKPKKISSACSCLVGTTLVSVATSTAAVEASTIAVSIPTSAVNASSAAVVSTGESEPVVSSTTVPTSAASTELAVAKVTSTSAAVAVAATGTACTVTAYSGIASAVASCTNIVLQDIAMPESQTLDLTDLQDGTTVTFAGNTSFATTVDSDFNPIEITGTNILITGASGHVIDGNGPSYWDGEGSNGGTDKPDHFIVLKDMISSTVSNLNIKNWPVHCFDVTGAQGLTITGLTLDNSEGDEPNSASGSDAAAHNSDGFDFSGSDTVTLSNTVVKNQDDCVAVTSGSNILITGLTCSGGHGLSIGSVGGKSNNTVSGITFSDSTVTDSANGCRIKSNSDTTGTIENIIYSNIQMSGITDYGIDIQQDYLNGGATGEPTNGVTISNVSFTNVTGTATSDAYDYYILCGSDSCSGFTFTDVSITGGGETSTCNFPTSGCPA